MIASKWVARKGGSISEHKIKGGYYGAKVTRILEDILNSWGKKVPLFSAGCIDGGFQTHEGLLQILED
jgi:hypothetical protein